MIQRIVLTILMLAVAGCGRSMCDIPVASGPVAGQPDPGAASMRILDYGPRSAKAGAAFNRQPDGKSAIWFKLDQSAEGSLVNVHVGGSVYSGDIAGDMVTLKLPDDAHEDAGTVALSLDKVDGQKVSKSSVVTLVLEKP